MSCMSRGLQCKKASSACTDHSKTQRQCRAHSVIVNTLIPVFAVHAAGTCCSRLRCQQLSGQLQSLAAEVDSASKAPGLKQGFALLKRCSKMAEDLQTGLAQEQR